jgi:hypothetical protein
LAALALQKYKARKRAGKDHELFDCKSSKDAAVTVQGPEASKNTLGSVAAQPANLT